MKKLMIVIPYFPPAQGGMEKHVHTIAKGLQKDHNWDIVIVTSNHERPSQYKEETLDGMKVYRLPRWFKVSNTPINPLWYWQIKRIIRKEHPDIINGRAPVPFIADVAARAAGKIPFVLGYHFPSMAKGNIVTRQMIRTYEGMLLPITLKKAHLIICSSDHVRLDFLKRYSGKSATITQGINQDIFKPIKMKKQQDLIFVGNFTTEVKGLHYLIGAIAMIKKDAPNIKVAIVGSGNIKAYQSMAKKLGISKNIIFKGALNSNQLAKEYNQSKIFILPSTNENFPSTLIEAMSCRLPCIATNVGGVKDLIENNKTGILIPSKNSQAIALAINKLLGDKNLAENISKNGYKQVKNRFNWANKINDTHKLLNAIKTKSS